MMHKLRAILFALLLYGLWDIPYVVALDDCVPESPSPPTATTNLGLYLPSDGQCGWGYRWNQNAWTLDALPQTGDPHTWTGEQTFNGGIVLGSGTAASTPQGMLGSTCILIKNLDADDHDNLQMEISPYAQGVTLQAAACTCMDTVCTTPPCCATGPVFSFTNSTNTAISLDAPPLACTLGTGAATWQDFSTADSDRILAEGDGPRISTTSAGAAGDQVIVCVRFIVNSIP